MSRCVSVCMCACGEKGFGLDLGLTAESILGAGVDVLFSHLVISALENWLEIGAVKNSCFPGSY